MASSASQTCVLGTRVVSSVSLLREYFARPVYQSSGNPAAYVARCMIRGTPWWLDSVGALEYQMRISSSRFMTSCFISFGAWLKTRSHREAFFDDFVWHFAFSDCVSLLPFFRQPPRCCHCLTYSVFACLSCFLFQPRMKVGSARAGILFTTEPQCLEQCLAQNRCSV